MKNQEKSKFGELSWRKMEDKRAEILRENREGEISQEEWRGRKVLVVVG